MQMILVNKLDKDNSDNASTAAKTPNGHHLLYAGNVHSV